MARNPLRSFNLGASGDPKAFAVDALPGGNGDLGGVYEDNSQNRFQCFQLVDAGLVANDVAFAKTHTGLFLATATMANSSRNEAVGVVTTTVLVNQYTLLQQGGVRLVKFNGTDGPAFGAVARGSLVIPDKTNANAVDTQAAAAAAIAATNNIVPIGVAQAAASAAPGTVSTFLTINAL